jgi:hypothetical protein
MNAITMPISESLWIITIFQKEFDIMKRAIALSMLAVGLIAVSSVRAHEKVKLTGYVVDVVCAADHTKDNPEDATKFDHSAITIVVSHLHQIALNMNADDFERQLDVFHHLDFRARMVVAEIRPALIELGSPTS